MKQLEITGTTILSAVIHQLHEKYPKVMIYKELVNQGMKFPRMTVLCEDFSERKLMRGNYLQTFIISVLYQYKEVPESSYFTSNEVAYDLIDCIRTIQFKNGDKLRGTDINHYVGKNSVEVYVNYTVKVASEEETKPKMLTQTVDVYTKNKKEK